MQQAIVIETLGDLHAHGYGMNAMCEKCRHCADLGYGGVDRAVRR
jgi:hypothetical protein